MQHKGIQDVATRVSGLELGGLAGSLSAGWLSDHLTKKNQAEGNKAGNVGLRVKVRALPLRFRNRCALRNASVRKTLHQIHSLQLGRAAAKSIKVIGM